MEAAMRTDQETQEMCKLCGKHPRWENMQLCAECLGKGKAPDEEPSVTTMPRKQHSRICPDCGKNHAGGKVGRGRTDVCQSCLTTKKQETREAQKRGAPLPLRAKRACAQPSGKANTPTGRTCGNHCVGHRELPGNPRLAATESQGGGSHDAPAGHLRVAAIGAHRAPMRQGGGTD
jgi:hypothetical protein